MSKALRERLAEAICDAMNMNRVGRLEIEAADAALSVLATLAEDEDTVERVARALCVDDGVDPDAVGYDRTGSDLPNWRVTQETARAALRALKDTKP